MSSDGDLERVDFIQQRGCVYQVGAAVVDATGQTAEIGWVVTIETNVPAISRVSPSNASVTFSPNTGIDFTVDVTDSDGDLERVDYYVDESLITDVPVNGSSDRATWQRSFTSEGVYQVGAVVVDETGQTAEIGWVVTIETNVPAISRVSPSNASVTFGPNTGIDFTVDVTDSDGDLERVDYYVDESLITDVPVNGSSDRATWQRSFTSEGVYQVGAVVVDATGQTAEIGWVVTIETNVPAISRVSPSNASVTFSPNTGIDFTVDVTDSDGDLERVDYYVDESLITDVPVNGSSDRATWQRSFTSEGVYQVGAVVVDETVRPPRSVGRSRSSRQHRGRPVIQAHPTVPS